KRGYEVIGIDGTRDMIERASRLPYKKLICQNLEKRWRVPDQSFDAAVMIGVMEYIDDPAAVLAQARRKLVDGGLFGLTVPHKSRWFADSDLKSYYRKEIEPVMTAAGFDIVEQEKIIGVEEENERAYYRNYLLKKTASA
ncbi:MAG TPA: class I SAM-dependent methyltransferase, partial [Blastocatellia bacterium]|nr:class I SAM-dependent methyltransferase [Blastocatellia bacterium]